MRTLLAMTVLFLAGCNGPQSAAAAPDRTTQPVTPPNPLTQPRSRSEILRAMRGLERLAVLSDGCQLDQRIVAAIITRVGATLFIGGTRHRLTPADRARAIDAGADDAVKERANGRAPDCTQVGTEIIAMARQYAVPPQPSPR